MLITQDWISKQDQESLLISAWQRLVNLMAELCDTPAGFIVQADSAEFKVIIANDKPENPYAAGATISANVNIFCRKVVELNKPLYEGRATENPEWLDNPEVSDDGFNTYLGYPLHWPDGSVFGTICVMDLAKTNFDQRYNTLLEHFREMAEKELELCDKNLQLTNLAYTDHLTNVLNRKGFFATAKTFLPEKSDSIAPTHICYFDIDNLKPINDGYGHRTGDTVIKRFAEHLTKAFEKHGVIARFGGDEFVVMLKESEDFDVAGRLNQLNQDIAEEDFEPKLCYSSGLASKAITAEDLTMLEQLIGEADKKMYQNKPDKCQNK